MDRSGLRRSASPIAAAALPPAAERHVGSSKIAMVESVARKIDTRDRSNSSARNVRHHLRGA